MSKTKPAKKPTKKSPGKSPSPAPVVRKTHMFDVDVALTRADDTLSLLERADGSGTSLRARVERRLPAGAVERLVLSANTLREKETSPSVALVAQKSATAGAHVTGDEALEFLDGIRHAVRMNKLPAAVQTKLGVGSNVHAKDRVKLAAILTTAAETIEDPAVATPLALFPEDAARARSYALALDAAGKATRSTRADRKLTTAQRALWHLQLEQAIREISVAGVLEFSGAKERSVRDEFRALTTVSRTSHVTTKGGASAPAATGSTATGTAGTKS